MFDMSVKWPGGARVAVMLTFDFDAETLWHSRDENNKRRPGTLSAGTYGSRVGVPKVLDTLDEAGNLPGTFYVPGWTAENHTDRVEMILKSGRHEIGHHSYSHTSTDGNREKEIEEMEKGLEALKRTVGVVPRGYRAPSNVFGAELFVQLQKHGFLYDSSMMDEINPYRIVMPDGTKGVVELPFHWSLDDAPFMLFSLSHPKTQCSNEHILSVWQAEFREIYRWGGLFDLVMHPQVIGRPSRIALLREMIAFIQTFPDVWFATGEQIADAWVANCE